jgi:hypothetical protein
MGKQVARQSAHYSGRAALCGDALAKEGHGDRRKVNEAVRDGLLTQLALWTSLEDIVRLNSELHALAEQIAWGRNKKV